MSYELTDSARIVHLKTFCSVKYAIHDNRVRAKRIRVYTAVTKTKEGDELAGEDVGFYSDIPGGQEVSNKNQDRIVNIQYVFGLKKCWKSRTMISSLCTECHFYS